MKGITLTQAQFDADPYLVFVLLRLLQEYDDARKG